MGDKLLQVFAQALTEVTRSTDLVCRWGGDEFVILFNSDKEVNSQQLIARINEFVHQGYPAHTIGFSSGVVTLDLNQDNTLEHVLIDADKAMYQQKLSLK
jgi:diguanylate cyclase (GGDEF)-like protein